MNQPSRYFCLAQDGLIWMVGHHADIEAAKGYAASIGLRCVFMADERIAALWLESLQSFSK